MRNGAVWLSLLGGAPPWASGNVVFYDQWNLQLCWWDNFTNATR